MRWALNGSVAMNGRERDGWEGVEGLSYTDEWALVGNQRVASLSNESTRKESTCKHIFTKRKGYTAECIELSYVGLHSGSPQLFEAEKRNYWRTYLLANADTRPRKCVLVREVGVHISEYTKVCYWDLRGVSIFQSTCILLGPQKLSCRERFHCNYILRSALHSISGGDPNLGVQVLLPRCIHICVMN